MAWLNAEKCERSTSLIDKREYGSVCWVVEAMEGPIVNTEAVLPQVQRAAHTRRGRAGVCGCSRGMGVFDDTRGSIVAAEGLCAA